MLDDVVQAPLAGAADHHCQLEESSEVLQDVRLLEPVELRDRFALDQGQFAFYAIRDLDVDRYDLDGAGAR
jgi:uncharacterized membrane protein (UPF0182 family)